MAKKILTSCVKIINRLTNTLWTPEQVQVVTTTSLAVQMNQGESVFPHNSYETQAI